MMLLSELSLVAEKDIVHYFCDECLRFSLLNEFCFTRIGNIRLFLNAHHFPAICEKYLCQAVSKVSYYAKKYFYS